MEIAKTRTLYADDVLVLCGRVLLSWLFVFDGFWKVVDIGPFYSGLVHDGLPAVAVLAPLSVAIEFLGGLSILLGFRLRYSTLLMILFTVIATLLRHRYWDFEGAARVPQVFNFYRNVSIVGGLLELVRFLWTL